MVGWGGGGVGRDEEHGEAQCLAGPSWRLH